MRAIMTVLRLTITVSSKLHLPCCRSCHILIRCSMCTMATRISGKPKKTKAFFASSSGPDAREVCLSAVIAATLFIFDRLGQINHEGLIELQALHEAIESSLAAQYICPLAPVDGHVVEPKAVTSIAFPERPSNRDLRSDFTLQMYEPHRRQPSTQSHCVLWGARRPHFENIWSAFFYTGSDALRAQVRTRVENDWQVKPLGSAGSSLSWPDLIWPHVCEAGIHMARTALREILMALDQLVRCRLLSPSCWMC